MFQSVLQALMICREYDDDDHNCPLRRDTLSFSILWPTFRRSLSPPFQGPSVPRRVEQIESAHSTVKSVTIYQKTSHRIQKMWTSINLVVWTWDLARWAYFGVYNLRENLLDPTTHYRLPKKLCAPYSSLLLCLLEGSMQTWSNLALKSLSFLPL